MIVVVIAVMPIAITKIFIRDKLDKYRNLNETIEKSDNFTNHVSKTIVKIWKE